MDLATMFVILLFRGGETGHFVLPARDMAACLRSLESEKYTQRLSDSEEAGYMIYGVCMRVSPRIFDIASRETEAKASREIVVKRRDPCGHGNLWASTTVRTGTLYLKWTGSIRTPFYKRVALEFEKAKRRVGNVLLKISSCGGLLSEMERTVRLLKHIRKTHALETFLGHGDVCASACIPIFLQGQRRWAALTSSWLFHEVWQRTVKYGGRVKVDRTTTERIFQDYFESAGVSEAWLNHLRIMVQYSDYWQTGQNLWEDKSGVITDPLENHVSRGIEEPRF